MSSIYSQKPWLRHYPVDEELPIPRITVLDCFEKRAGEAPDAPAIHHFDDTISFGEFEDRAERFASLLSRCGFVSGDRVALSLQNDPEFVIAVLGAWKRGGIVVPLNPMFRRKELEYHLADCGARVWIVLDSLATAENRDAAAAAGVQHVFTVQEFAGVLAQQTRDPAAHVRPSPDDIAYLVYTSGTTGNPKGAIIPHSSLAFNAEVYRVWMEIGPDDVILGLAPLFHITGLVAYLALSFRTGIPLILFHRFDVTTALYLAKKWRGTMTVAAITAYIALMNCEDEQPRFITKCYSGGAPVPPAVVNRFEARFGAYIHNIYGLTETTSPSHAVPLGVAAPVDPATGALAFGFPIPNCEARVVSLEDPGTEVPPGVAGELVLKGPFLFAGYWNKPQESERAFHNGYFRTGDVAWMDEQGWFYLVDRKKDMIVASGFKIWPREVEDTIYQHPAVREVAVIGVPDAYRGENVKAFVVLRENFASTVDAQEIIGFCRERISAYKCPREVEFIAEVPKTATGKFLRRALRERDRPAGMQ
ncbi:MAG TPA: AMP-binding protein [Bryobacteraceae bacterium]|nr:AMP-binding protein [Bryobacteraceae bacterium]